MTGERRGQLVVWAVLGAVLLLYLVTAAPAMVGTDNGEFVVLGAEGGVAHPPGYPLATLYYRAMSWMPGKSAAHGAALATAVLGALAVALVYVAGRGFRASRWGALVAAAFFGLTTEVWVVHTHAEAFALNNLLGAAILAASAPGAPLKGARRVVVLGLLAGLGISNHHSIVLLAPVGLYGVWLGASESRRGMLAVMVGAAALAVGLLPDGYLVWGGGDCETCLRWGQTTSWEGFWHHVLRKDYGTLTLGPGSEPQPWRHIGVFFIEVVSETAVVGFGLAVGGVMAATGRLPGSPRSQDRREELAWFWLLVTFALVGPLFFSRFNVDPRGPGLVVVKRFHVLPWLVMAPMAARGVDWAWARFEARRAAVALVLAAALVVTAGLGLQTVKARYDRTIEDYIENMLRPLPPDTVLVGSGNHRYLGVQLKQRLEGLRPDVSHVVVHLMGHDWYIEPLERRLQVALPRPERDEATGVARVDVEAILEALLASGRPVFLTDDDFAPHRTRRFRRTPFGAGYLLLPEGQRQPTAAEAVERNEELYRGFQLGASPDYEHHPWGWSLWHDYVVRWEELARGCREAGAEGCEEVARGWVERLRGGAYSR